MGSHQRPNNLTALEMIRAPRSASQPTEQVRETDLKPFGNFLNIHKRDISDPALDAAVVSPVKATSFGGFLLIDALDLAQAANRTAKPNPDVYGHHLK